MTGLTERAMLARVKITQWSATRLDRKITQEVHQQHNAHGDAGRFNKRLISKDAIAAIQTIASEARALHYKRTLPWQDDGVRILSAVGYFEYMEKMGDLQRRFQDAADQFAAGYDDFVLDAKARLNGMFNEADYPPRNVVRNRFGFSVSVDPLPDAADFRVNLGDAQAQAIRDDIEARSKEALAQAMRDVWERVSDCVGHMAGRLKAYKPAGKSDRAEGIFRDSLVENVRELTGLLHSLNLTGDAKLAEIADRMQALCRDDADTLRANASTRASVAKEADSILADVKEYLA